MREGEQARKQSIRVNCHLDPKWAVRGHKQEMKADDNKSKREISSTAKLEDICCVITPLYRTGLFIT